MATCNECNKEKSDVCPRIDGKIRCDECESKKNIPPEADASAQVDSGKEPIVINSLLCFIQYHLKRTVKTNIIECVSRHFSLDDAIVARDVLNDTYGDRLGFKMKLRRNTVSKPKVDSIMEDIVNVMMDIDQKKIKTKIFSAFHL